MTRKQELQYMRTGAWYEQQHLLEMLFGGDPEFAGEKLREVNRNLLQIEEEIEAMNRGRFCETD